MIPCESTAEMVCLNGSTIYSVSSTDSKFELQTKQMLPC